MTKEIIEQMLEIISLEIKKYRLMKEKGVILDFNEQYYAGLAHSYKGLVVSLEEIKKTQKILN